MQTNYWNSEAVSEALRFGGRSGTRTERAAVRSARIPSVVAEWRNLARSRAWEQAAWLTLAASSLVALVLSAW